MKNMSSREGTGEGNPKLRAVRTDSIGETISVSPPSPPFFPPLYCFQPIFGLQLQFSKNCSPVLENSSFQNVIP